MYIEKINLINYRNIKNIEFKPSENCNILYGKNGQGKTNIIEAIYLLSYMKSFRQAKNCNFIGEENTECNIRINFELDSSNYIYNLNINNKNKTININNKLPENSSYLNYIKSVIYSSDELQILRGSNLLKRNFIDRGLFLIDKNYLNLVKKYNFILKSRNILLKNKINNDGDINLWTDLLVETGVIIRKRRFEYLYKYNIELEKIYNLIFDEKTIIGIKHQNFETPIETLKNEFLNDLLIKRENELLYGQTLSGPHLDKIDFLINNKDIRYYGSQGQLRAVLLSFKLAQLFDYKNKFGKFPILLLDDICSEIDKKKIDYLFEYIRGNIGQIFITTTAKNNFNRHYFNKVKFYKLDCGEITLD